MNLNDIKKSSLIEYARQRYGVKCDASGKASCPFHPPDKTPSFSIYQTKAGVWRFKCFHEDRSGSIIDLKMELENLSRKEACSQLLKEFKEGEISPFPKKNHIPTATVAVLGGNKGTAGKAAVWPNDKQKKTRNIIPYDYKDRDGKIIYRKEKHIYLDGTKKLFFKHEVKPGLWDWTKGKADHIPYNLDQFKDHVDVIVCEGEKDANTITQLKIGVLATTAPTGKGAWPDTITQYFKSFKKATFLYDVGAEKDVKKHAATLKKAFPEMHIFIASMPMDKEGSDITDYLETQKGEKAKQMALLDVLDKTKEFKVEDILEDRVHIINVDEVEAKPIRWLWHHVFPIGKVSLLVGDGGAGKSYFANYMASRITTGRDWIDQDGNQPIGKVLIITTEDGVADTIKARAILMGTDQANLKIIDGVSEGISKDVMSLTIGKNIRQVEKAIAEIGNVRLLVFDPITEFIGNIDDHRAAPTRTALAPLAALAEKYNIAILIISHLNKDDAKKLIYRTTGSQSYVNMARAVWAIAEDEETEDRRFLMPVKQNLSKKPPALAFSITNGQGIVFEKEPVKVIADQVFGTEDQRYERSQLDEAKTFLFDLLELGSVRANEIFKEAHQAGISEKTLRRAKSALNVLAIQTYEEGNRFWIWKQKK